MPVFFTAFFPVLLFMVFDFRLNIIHNLTTSSIYGAWSYHPRGAFSDDALGDQCPATVNGLSAVISKNPFVELFQI